MQQVTVSLAQCMQARLFLIIILNKENRNRTESVIINGSSVEEKDS